MTITGPRSHLEALLRSGQFVVTSELQSSDSADPLSVHRRAQPLAGFVDAVNCTDNSSAHVHVSAVAAAHLLVEAGLEPIVQFTCRDRNRLALQSDLMGAALLGAHNLLLMAGDDVGAGDHPGARAVYDLDVLELLRAARQLRDDGTYLSGRKLEDRPHFFIGAVENPFAPPVESRPGRLAKKVEAGAEFIQTQIVFNVPRLQAFLAHLADMGVLERVFLLPSVYVPRSTEAARYLRDRVPGVDVPEAVIDRLEGRSSDGQAEEGIALAVEIVEELRRTPGVAGIHLISIKWEAGVRAVVERAGLLPRPEASATNGVA